MSKKTSTILLVPIILTASLLSAPAMCTKRCFTNQCNSESLSLNAMYDKTKESEISEILHSTTLGDFIDTLREYIRQTFPPSPYRERLMNMVENGVNEMEKIGLTYNTSLSDTGNILENGIFNRKPVRYRPFLINVLPSFVMISTTIPPYEYNISKNNQSSEYTYKIEFFIKIIPFIDFVVTEQFGILRKKLVQTSILWPSIGGRILLKDFTLFILAFGPRIQWKRI